MKDNVTRILQCQGNEGIAYVSIQFASYQIHTSENQHLHIHSYSTTNIMFTLRHVLLQH